MRLRAFFWIVLGGSLLGCSRNPTAPAAERNVATSAVSSSARAVSSAPAALHVAETAPAEPPVPSLPPIGSEPVIHHGIPWYRDAPEAALAQARREKKPLVVDLWAAWCHTCLSMQAFVLTDALLPGARERFVFLAVDTERPENAEFLRRFAATVWPTFYVLDPEEPAVRGRWLGAASPAEFVRFLDEGARSVELGRAGSLAADDPRTALLNGDRLAAEKQYEAAAGEYAKALERGGKAWPQRSSTLVARIASLSKGRAFAPCADLGVEAMSDTGTGVNAVDFASFALSCASNLPKEDPRIASLRRKAEQRLSALCQRRPKAPVTSRSLTPDDRADACGNLQAVRNELADLPGAKRAAEIGLSIVEAASANIPDDVALTYDRARSDFLSALGRSDEALALLTAREAALPDNYNPPHLQARVYKQLARWSDGLSAIDRAIGKAYGPRRINLMSLKVDLLLGADRKGEAILVLSEQITSYGRLAEGQKQEEARQNAVKRLASLK